MTISTIALDLTQSQPQPRKEPAYSRPRPSPRLRRANGVSSIRSPRVLLDVDLSVQASNANITAARPLHIKEDVEAELGTESQTKARIVLTEGEKLITVSRLSRPAWPKSSPTIPTTLYKTELRTKV